MNHGVIGVGAIAAAIVTGLCEDVDQPPSILLSPRNAAIAAALASRHPTVRVCADNQAVVDSTSVLILCLRPQDARAVLGNLTFSADHVIISVMAGTSVEELAPLVAPAREIVCAIPLPSVARREGITPIHPPILAARTLFDRLGGSIELSDVNAFNALFASTATIAAHLTFLGTISRWLASRGIPDETAMRYVASIFAGLAPALLSEQDFEHLARDHATPGGINEYFLNGLNEAGIFNDVELGLERVFNRLTSRTMAASSRTG